ncbi:hypothetical protein F4808DRAFT_445306 [Astrocystis sublimbata]|nr:hypothetical protein F4808DRAFT_445306 [Astrocystis sublimbata]
MAGFDINTSANISASRQKNCNSCVQAKRRCDRRMPVCSRCVAKEMPCVYSKSRTAVRLEKRAGRTTPSTETSVDFEGLSFAMDSDYYLEDMPPNFHASAGVESTPNSVHDTMFSGDTSIDAFMHLMGGSGPSSSTPWAANTEEQHFQQLPTPADEEVMKSYEKMQACRQTDASDIYDPKTPLYYIFNRVKAFTRETATKHATPFMHGRLYQDFKPQSIISSFTSCVLYESRTPTNRTMVMRSISGHARELVNTEMCRVIKVTPIEKLARSQALFLYQVIRLFDGDVALRAQGEKDMGLLRTWLNELCHIRDNLGDIARLEYSTIKEQSPIEWEKWIFAECVRRTIIITYATISLYELLKDPEFIDPANTWEHVHRWTLGRSLWDARSSADFRRAWKDSPHYVISNFAFDKFLENGKGEDVDEFAQILLNAVMGVDAMKEFMSSRENKQVMME